MVPISRSDLEKWNALPLEARGPPYTVNNTYRIRICPVNAIPILRDTHITGDILIIDMPPTQPANAGMSDGSDDTTAMSRSMCSEDDYDDDDDESGPLKFKFVTLASLQRKSEWNLIRPSSSICALEFFDCSPMSYRDGYAFQAHLLDVSSKELDPALLSMPTFMITDASDQAGTSLLASYCIKNRITTVNTRFLGYYNPAIENILTGCAARFNESIERRCKATAVYRLLSAVDSEKKRKIVPAMMTMKFKWSIGISPTTFLVPPSPTATAVYHVAPGWMDARICYRELSVKVSRLMHLSSVLMSNDPSTMVWPRKEAHKYSVIEEKVQALIDSSKGINRETSAHQARFLDFTEQLSIILQHCDGMESLIDALRLVFEALKKNQINTILHNSNKCMLARLVRDSLSGDLLLPRLEGLTPVQILMEISYECIRRELVHLFISSSLLGSEDELTAFLSPVPTEEVEKRVQRLLPVHLALQTMTEIVKNLELGSHQITTMSRAVLIKYCNTPLTDISKVFYEPEIPLVHVKSSIREKKNNLVLEHEMASSDTPAKKKPRSRRNGKKNLGNKLLGLAEWGLEDEMETSSSHRSDESVPTTDGSVNGQLHLQRINPSLETRETAAGSDSHDYSGQHLYYADQLNSTAVDEDAPPPSFHNFLRDQGWPDEQHSVRAIRTEEARRNTNSPDLAANETFVIAAYQELSDENPTRAEDEDDVNLNANRTFVIRNHRGLSSADSSRLHMDSFGDPFVFSNEQVEDDHTSEHVDESGPLSPIRSVSTELSSSQSGGESDSSDSDSVHTAIEPVPVPPPHRVLRVRAAPAPPAAILQIPQAPAAVTIKFHTIATYLSHVIPGWRTHDVLTKDFLQRHVNTTMEEIAGTFKEYLSDHKMKLPSGAQLRQLWKTLARHRKRDPITGAALFQTDMTVEAPFGLERGAWIEAGVRADPQWGRTFGPSLVLPCNRLLYDVICYSLNLLTRRHGAPPPYTLPQWTEAANQALLDCALGGV